MSFFAILFALLIEQARPLARSNPVHAGLRLWARWVSRNFDAGKSHHGWVAWALTVVGPTLAAAVIYWLLDGFVGWPLAIVWSTVVLYFTLGFRQFSHHFTAIRDALDAGDEAQARELLAQWQRVEVADLPRSELLRHVIEYSVLAAHRHVFGVFAWFSLLAALGLGPAGAVLYRMSEYVSRYANRPVRPTGTPLSSTTSGVAKALRKSPSPVGLPCASRSLKSTLRSVRQTVCPVFPSNATTYWKSLPSKFMISMPPQTIGDDPEPRKWLHTKSVRSQIFAPVFSSRHAVPGDPKLTYTLPALITGVGEA